MKYLKSLVLICAAVLVTYGAIASQNTVTKTKTTSPKGKEKDKTTSKPNGVVRTTTKTIPKKGTTTK
jgi:hypothetical protein